MKKSLALASLALVAASLTACGGDDGGGDSASGGGDYCDLIKSAEEKYDDLDFTSMGDEDLSAFQSDVEEIQAAAPDEVKDQWGTLSEATSRFQEILSDAGISLEDLDDMQSGEVPEGADLDKLQTAMTELQEFTQDTSFADASEQVQQNVQEECDIQMGDDSGSESGN